MKKIILCIWSYTLVYTLFSCQHPTPNIADLSAPAGTITQKFSDMADSLQAIPLETSDSCLLAQNLLVWLGNKYIITADREAIHLFDRNGKHIRRLANQGKGPGEFSSLASFTVDEPGERLYYTNFIKKKSLQIIDLKTGKNTDKISIHSESIASMLVYGDHHLICCPFLYQNEPYDLFTLSENGEMISSLPGDTIQDMTRRLNFPYLQMIGDRISFRNPKTDILFQTDGTSKTPLVFIKLENPINDRQKQGNTFQINAETAEELFISVYEMKVKESSDIFGIFPVNPQIPPRRYRINKNDRTVHLIDRFYNDLLEEYSIFPNKIVTIGNHIFTQKSAVQIKKLAEKKIKAGEKLSPALQELNTELTEDANPVIIVGTLKKPL